MTRLHSSSPLWPWAAGLLCTVVVDIAVLADGVRATPVVTAALVAITIAGFAAAWRNRAFDRIGCTLFGLGTLVSAASLPFGAAGHPSALSSATAAAVGVTLIAMAMPFFTVRSVPELLAAELQWSVLSCSLFIAIWVLAPSSLRWSSGLDHDMSVVTTVILSLDLAASLHAALAAVARPGRSRMLLAVLAVGLTLGLGSDLVIQQNVGDVDAAAVGLLLRGPSLGLALVACVGAALRPHDGPRRPVLNRARDLTILSLVTVALVGASLVTSGTRGLDRTLCQALAGLVALLVVTHLVETRRSQELARSVEQQGHHLRLLVSETRDIIMELDPQGRVTFASDAIEDVLGVTPAQAAGRPVHEIIPEIDADARSHVPHAPGSRVQPTLRLLSAVRTGLGPLVHVESVITPLNRGYLVAVRDVSERVGLQSRLQQVTYHDDATGLPNRASLERELRHRLYEAATGEIALAVIDLNPAGLSDNALGDETHEVLLRRVGAVLREQVRPGDTVARYGDHRFAVLLRAGTEVDDALSVAATVTDAVNDPRQVPDVDLHACAAVAYGGHSSGDVVRNAELALRQARATGSGCVQLFEPGMLTEYARTRDLRRRLARTPDADHWTVLYQPVVDLRTGRYTGVEALLRWTDPDGDLIGIEEVIRLAEEYGSIIAIGSWVLDQAVAQAARWEDAGHPLQVAVNVSVHQLTAPGFAALVADTLERHGLGPHRLTLEITETVVLEQTQETISTLSELRALGVKIAIDDFGTGYSGLANLRSLPLDILKIDRTFVQGLGMGGGDEAVVRAVTQLGRTLALAITAEGIETREQEEQARLLGITAAQGYLYARPVSAAEISARVARAGSRTDADLTI